MYVMESASAPRRPLDENLREMEHDLLGMGTMVEGMVAQAVESLVTLNADKAHEVMRRDDEVDKLDLDIEVRCIRMLALQQPAAGDLRTIGAAMKMIVDLERVGDLSVDIAKIGLKIDKEMGQADFIDLRRMARSAGRMLHDALQAYVRRDLALATAVCVMDDEVDEQYRDLRSEIHAYMVRHPDEVVSASWLLLAIHHIERIADHAANIAERVAFLITGRLEQLTPSHRSDAV